MATTISGDDNFDTGNVGAQLIGTLNMAAATSNTLSSVDLSGYNWLRVELNAVMLSVSSRQIYLQTNGERGLCAYSQGATTTYGCFARGEINLSNGIGWFGPTGIINLSNYGNYTSTAVAAGGRDYGITNSTTSLTLYAHSGASFLATGSVKFYGVN